MTIIGIGAEFIVCVLVDTEILPQIRDFFSDLQLCVNTKK